jgi:4-hydroxybenzoate polyprenyltransferase
VTLNLHIQGFCVYAADKFLFSRTMNSTLASTLTTYLQLTRLNRPIGIYLVLWPTLWSLWLAAKGAPDIKNLIIFILGCILMRSAGCVINDYADRDFDGRVQRTRDRPLATGAVSSLEAIALFVGLCFLSFILVLFTNWLTIKLAFAGLALAISYPFMKRYTHLPQVVLGAAFGWAIPMAFAAQSGEVPLATWLVFTAALLWTVCYDTFYAMVDREDDLKIGVKSTAVLFGELDRVMTGSLQVLALLTLLLVGKRFELSWVYYVSVAVAAGLFAYQQYLIRDRERNACFAAFLNNNWVGIVIFIGIVGHYALYPDLS